MTPTRGRSARASRTGSRPRTRTVPWSGRRYPSQISTVVVLPAPFGPRMPVTSPRAALSVSPSTAVVWPYRLTSPPISTAGLCGTVLTDASLRSRHSWLCCACRHRQRQRHAREDGPMDSERARSLLTAERDEVQGLLKDAEADRQEARVSEVD